MLGQAHEIDQKLTEKIYRKAEFNGLGPFRKLNSTGLIPVPHQLAVLDAYVAWGGC